MWPEGCAQLCAFVKGCLPSVVELGGGLKLTESKGLFHKRSWTELLGKQTSGILSSVLPLSPDSKKGISLDGGRGTTSLLFSKTFINFLSSLTPAHEQRLQAEAVTLAGMPLWGKNYSTPRELIYLQGPFSGCSCPSVKEPELVSTYVTVEV